MSRCVEVGHDWRATAAIGWFRCARLAEVRTRKAKSKTGGDQIIWVPCAVIGHCPGCLGYWLEGYVVAFCGFHQSCTIEQFSMVVCPPTALEFPSTTVEQGLLWS